jgi:hypothetical protein
MASRTLSVEVTGDASGLERAFNRAGKSARSFSGQIEGTFGARAGGATRSFERFNTVIRKNAFVGGLAGGAAVLGGQQLADQIKQSIDVASNLNEQVSKSRAIFGDASAAIEDWSKTTARSIGIARDQALEATGTFGGLFNTVGLAPAKAADLSRSLVQLAADLASFNNASPEEALAALRSGLAGESEPLRRFQVLLSEAKVSQQALADTGKKTTKDLTDQEKVLARLAIIFRETAPAQGDAARTAGNFAQQSRTLSAQMRDLRANIGKVLLPGLTGLVQGFNDAAAGASTLAQKIGELGDVKLPGTKKEVSDLEKAVIPVISLLRETGNLKKAIIPVLSLFQELGKSARESGEAIQFTATQLNQAFTFKLPQAPKKPEEIFPPFKGAEVPDRGIVLTAEQRQKFFDARIARELDKLQDVDLSKQLAGLDRISKQISERIAKTRDITRKLNLEDQLREIGRQAKGVRADLGQEFLDRLSLGVDRAQITPALNNDIDALNKLLSGIRERISIEGATVDLRRREVSVIAQIASLQQQQVDQANKLFDTRISGAIEKAVDRTNLRKQIAGLRALEGQLEQRMKVTKDVARKAELASQLRDVTGRIRTAQEKIATEFFDRLQLKVDLAGISAGFRDDISALTSLQRQIQRRIKEEGRTLELQQRLVSVRGSLATARKGLREERRDRRIAEQFRQLGLGPTGQERIPGVQALRRQAGALGEAIEGTFLDTAKTRGMLGRIRSVLNQATKGMAEDVRKAVFEMLKDLDKQLDDSGRATKFRKANADKLLAGLGLTPDQLRAARGRIAQIGAGGTINASTGGPVAFGIPTGITITGPINVNANNADEFIQDLQRKAGRTAAQRGGRIAAKRLGLN